MRVGVFYKPIYGDGRAQRLLSSLRGHHGLPVTACALVDVYLLDKPVEQTKTLGALADGVAQSIDTRGDPACHLMPDWQTLVEVTTLPGVTDPVAMSAVFALRTALGGRTPPHVQT